MARRKKVAKSKKYDNDIFWIVGTSIIIGWFLGVTFALLKF